MILPPRDFGPLPDGSRAVVHKLVNRNGWEAELCDYGAVLVALRVPDSRGNLADVVLGYDRAADYKHHVGATVGRFAGPIAAGRCVIDGTPLPLALNGGTYHIHGGAVGFAKRLWRAEPAETPEGPSVRFSRLSPDGEEGYPGNLPVSVTYTLTHAGELKLDYEASTDKTTLCNLTNHSYFNLGGHDSGPIVDHEVQFEADTYNLNDADIIAPGPVASVTGTPFDFTRPRPVKDGIGGDHEQIRFGQGYDHNFLLPRAPAALRKAARVRDPKSGRTLEMWTTEPGFQFYTGNGLPGGEAGKNGAIYGTRHGLCLEAQRAPNWPERPAVAGALLLPGEAYRQTTLYRFFCS
ncbi:MAG: aldose epimerase family protein [Kiritimatiellia bacterium]